MQVQFHVHSRSDDSSITRRRRTGTENGHGKQAGGSQFYIPFNSRVGRHSNLQAIYLQTWLCEYDDDGLVVFRLDLRVMCDDGQWVRG